MPYPLPLPLRLPLPGLDIRTELKGVFHFSVSRLDNVVLVHFGGKNLFWSNLAKKNGSGQFWPVKLG